MTRERSELGQPASIIGAQIAGLGNWNVGGSDIYGIQATLGLNTNGRKSVLIGLGVGVLGNSSQGMVAGAQLGIYNQAKDVYGLQLGIVNVAQSLHGVQIGLVNINKKGAIPILPILNMGF